jgi:hypothetical protein
MLQQVTPIANEAVYRPDVDKAILTHAELQAIESFWEFRIYMNPRLTLRGKWFPRSLAWKLRKFWDDFKAGKRPIMLLETPPQHGKSLTVIDFIAWAVGHDPELRVIYTSFSDRLSIRANLRMHARSTIQCTNAFFPTRRSKRRAAGARCATTTSWNFSTTTATSAIPPCSDRSRARRSIRGQWSALEREEKIKFWAERDRNNSRPGAYEVGVEHGIVSQLATQVGTAGTSTSTGSISCCPSSKVLSRGISSRQCLRPRWRPSTWRA